MEYNRFVLAGALGLIDEENCPVLELILILHKPLSILELLSRTVVLLEGTVLLLVVVLGSVKRWEKLVPELKQKLAVAKVISGTD